MNTHPQQQPLFLSPALPSDLLQFVINRCSYPTTLIICADRAEFLSSLTQDLVQQQEQQQPQSQPQRQTAQKPHDTTVQQTTADLSHQDRHQNQDTRHPPPPAAHPPNQPQPHSHHPVTPNPKPHPLLTPSLSQLSTTRHIRTVFIPTVSHLRAFLSVFSVSDRSSSSSSSVKVPPPPQPPALPHPGNTTAATTRGRERAPRLVVFSFLALHRHTSEWSVQGLGASAALLVEAGRRAGMGVVIVEVSQAAGSASGSQGMEEVLRERVPVLSGSARRELGWAGKTVDVGRVLGRWFRFREREWCDR